MNNMSMLIMNETNGSLGIGSYMHESTMRTQYERERPFPKLKVGVQPRARAPYFMSSSISWAMAFCKARSM